jgi:hypothetical protein
MPARACQVSRRQAAPAPPDLARATGCR